MAPPDPKESGMGAGRLSRQGSNSSLMRPESATQYVDDKQLGPQKMKQKVNQRLAHDQWHQGPPKFSGGGLPPRSAQKPRRDEEDEDSEENYDEGFEDADEVERIRIAMEREKNKAQQHIPRQPKEDRAASRLKFGAGPKDNAPSFANEKNLESFSRPKTLLGVD